MRRFPVRGRVPLIALGLCVPVAAQAFETTILYVNTPGHPTNVVPGLPGISFKAGAITTAFGRPIVSQNGLHLGINCTTTEAAAVDDVLLVDGVLVLKEGQPTPWPTAGENVGAIDEEFGINDAGDLLLGNGTSGPSTANDYMVLFQSGVWTVLAQETGLVSSVLPGLLGDAGGTATWDDTLDSARLTNGGATLWRGAGIDGLTTGTANDALVHLGGGTALQKNVSVPTGQAGGATAAWESFDLEDVYVSADGLVVLVQGDLTGATTSDDVLVRNGVVVIQEGSTLPGLASPVSTNGLGIVKGWVDRAGNWYARGNNTDTNDWVVRNGVVVAQSDGSDEIVAGSGEHWDDASFANCFFAFDGNALGQFVIAGVTDATGAANGVIVWDDGAGGRLVVVREGDPVDLDGNGLFDDDRFFDTFGNDDVLLQDDGSIIFTAVLRNSAFTAVDQGLFRRTPRAAGCTFRNGSGINPVAVSCLTLPTVGTTWQIAVTPGPNTLATFLYADPTPIPAFPLFGGELLIAPTAFLIPTSIVLPYDYQGLEFSLQAVRVDFDGVDLSLVLTNAQDAVIGF